MAASSSQAPTTPPRQAMPKARMPSPPASSDSSGPPEGFFEEDMMCSLHSTPRNDGDVPMPEGVREANMEMGLDPTNSQLDAMEAELMG
eukprot:4164174-Alexandrium_andersonii.AAC.1